MSRPKLNNASEQNILNMLMEQSLLDNKNLSKINSTSQEIGKSKIETAFELNLFDEHKILNTLANTYSLEVVNLSEKKIDEKLKKVLDVRFIEEN